MAYNSYMSPSANPSETLTRPRSFVFSPINEENPDSYSTTPRRKLCLDNSIQTPTALGSGDMRSPSNDTTHLYSRRQKSPIILPGKENVYDYSKTRPLSSLPTSPLSNNNIRSAPYIKQIFSPLERMKLDSPLSISDNSNTSSSDGYFSEVFESSSENSNSSIPDSINTIITQPFAININTSNKCTPTSIVQSHSCRADCLKRPTPSDKDLLPGERHPKRTPLADTGNLASPNRKHIKGTALFRTQSLSVPLPPCENAMFPISPGEGGIETIGDHSKPYILPLTCQGNITDLKNITSETLSRLINNDYCDLVDSYTIVDCRYPYEYNGGHIKNAINIWEKNVMKKRFFTSPTHPDEDGKRNIIIFHCEFSSKRGPEMSRYMRKIDREKNGMNFPKLYYPEIYLLFGGYKNFYNSYQLLCEPQSYKCMIDENHKEDLKHFSKRSKSWNSGDNNNTSRRLRHRHSAHDITGLSGGKY